MIDKLSFFIKNLAKKIILKYESKEKGKNIFKRNKKRT